MNGRFSTGVFFVLLSLQLLTGCAPWSKQSYVEKYERFMKEVAENAGDYSEEEWNDREAEFEKYAGEWYDRFESEFSTREKVVLAGYKVKFIYYRSLHEAKGAAEGLWETLNVEELKDRVQYYIENDMEDDLDELYDKAARAGEQAEETVRKICEELDVDIESRNS